MHILCICIGLLEFAAQVPLNNVSESIKHQGTLELCKTQQTHP